MLSFQWMTWMASPKAIKQLLERTSEAQLPGSMTWPWHAMAPHSFSCCAYPLLNDVFPGVLFVYLTVLARYGGMEHDCCWHQTCRKAAEEVWQDNKTSSSWVWRRQDKYSVMPLLSKQLDVCFHLEAISFLNPRAGWLRCVWGWF
jgi:hypothetical protein